MYHLEIAAQIDDFHGSEVGVLKEVCDGSTFKQHTLFIANKTTIQIFEQIELCNPVGSATKKNTNLVAFFTIGILHPCTVVH